MKRKAWTKEETLLAINLYCKIPFGKTHHRNPEVIELAGLIGRTPSSVALKLGNIACLDPDLERKGLSNYTKLDSATWNEFSSNWENLAYESEKLLAKYMNKDVEEVSQIPQDDIPKEGKEREIVIRARINQSFFRKMILSSYSNKCCITGIDLPKLLIASHIIPWSHDQKNRLNPRNGLCLNALHDKAFDQGIISISSGMKMLISHKVKSFCKNEPLSSFLTKYEDEPINLPKRFLPDKIFLEYHRDVIFEQ